MRFVGASIASDIFPYSVHNYSILQQEPEDSLLKHLVCRGLGDY